MSAVTAVDHLLLGAGDLDAGIDWVEKQTGVRAVAGGSHPGRGTRNALLALSGRRYLEIIAADPAQGKESSPELRALREPRLITWAAGSTDISAVARRIGAAGLSSPGLRPGSRARPDGRILKWTTLSIETKFEIGGCDPVPFFIEWDTSSPHPSQESPKGCELTTLEFEHPNADPLRRALHAIGIDATVRAADAPKIIATLKTPRGHVRLR
jgi:hypothetical protein